MRAHCATKDAPGGDQCSLQVGHVGPHSWEGGGAVKDLAGNPLVVGDRVAYPYRTGGQGSSYALALGHIVRFTPKGVTVHTSGNPKPRSLRRSQVVRA